MEQTPIEIDLTPIVMEFLALVVNVLVLLLFLSVAVYLLVGVPLIVYLSHALDRRAGAD